MTPKEKALKQIQKTQELNRKLRILGVSIHEATVEDYNIEIENLRSSLTLATETMKNIRTKLTDSMAGKAVGIDCLDTEWCINEICKSLRDIGNDT